MNYVLSIRITPIRWYGVEKTANMPFGFLSAVDIKIVTAMSSRAIPFGDELQAVKLHMTLTTRLAGSFDLKGEGLYTDQ